MGPRVPAMIECNRQRCQILPKGGAKPSLVEGLAAFLQSYENEAQTLNNEESQLWAALEQLIQRRPANPLQALKALETKLTKQTSRRNSRGGAKSLGKRDTIGLVIRMGDSNPLR